MALTLCELETLDRAIKLVEKILEDGMPPEEHHFEEVCETLEQEADELSIEELEKVAEENGATDHIYIAYAKLDDLLPNLKSMLSSNKATNQLLYYSEYFRKNK